MLLGIDVGTSAVKAVLLDGLTLVASESAGLSTESPRIGWSEQNPEHWWQASCRAIGGAAKRAGVDLSDVSAIGLSGQMHGAVLLGKDDNPLRPCILWNDCRSVDEGDLLAERISDIGLVAGVPPLPGFTAPKIMWTKKHEPAVYREIRSVLLPKDYVGLKLHGARATDHSDAAGTLWLDQARRSWSRRLCEASDTDLGWLPELFDGHAKCGEVSKPAADCTGLSAGTPVFAGGGDAAAGAVSVGATVPGRGFISLGTSGQLFVCTSEYRPNPEQLVHAFAHTVPHRWYQMAAMLNGARPLAWIAGVLRVGVGEVLTLAENADLGRVPLFLPYLTGERSPHGDPRIRGAFYGLEDLTTREAMCRAVLESIGFSMADACASFGDTLSGLPELLAIGGGAKSATVLQTVANATGAVLARAPESGAGAAVGAALLAGVGSGRLKFGDLERKPPVEERFEPRRDEHLQERLCGYRRLYGALKPIA